MHAKNSVLKESKRWVVYEIPSKFMHEFDGAHSLPEIGSRVLREDKEHDATVSRTATYRIAFLGLYLCIIKASHGVRFVLPWLGWIYQAHFQRARWNIHFYLGARRFYDKMWPNDDEFLFEPLRAFAMTRFCE